MNRRPSASTVTATLLGLCAVLTLRSAGSLEPAHIRIKDFMFTPSSITVSAGSSVTWTNLDDDPHTVVSDTGLYRSGGMDTNDSFTYRFVTPGTYHFTCSIHPKMVGTIVVQ